MPSTPQEDRLRSLQAHYTERINAAVAAGRLDLVRDLAKDCQDETLAVLADGVDSTQEPNQKTVEILELGGWHWRAPRSRRKSA